VRISFVEIGLRYNISFICSYSCIYKHIAENCGFLCITQKLVSSYCFEYVSIYAFMSL
jgi:hypothetical protein